MSTLHLRNLIIYLLSKVLITIQLCSNLSRSSSIIELLKYSILSKTMFATERTEIKGSNVKVSVHQVKCKVKTKLNKF